MNDHKARNELLNHLHAKNLERTQVLDYLDCYRRFASSLARIEELPTLQRLGVQLLELTIATKVAIEEDMAGRAALFMYKLQEDRQAIEVELGRLNAITDYDPETLDPTEKQVLDVMELSRQARLNEERINERATELARETKSNDASHAANRRHEGWRLLREYAEHLYSEGTWPSRNAAKRQILPALFERAEELGIRPAERFPQTVYEWLTKYDKNARQRADV